MYVCIREGKADDNDMYYEYMSKRYGGATAAAADGTGAGTHMHEQDDTARSEVGVRPSMLKSPSSGLFHVPSSNSLADEHEHEQSVAAAAELNSVKAIAEMLMADMEITPSTSEKTLHKSQSSNSLADVGTPRGSTGTGNRRRAHSGNSSKQVAKTTEDIIVSGVSNSNYNTPNKNTSAGSNKPTTEELLAKYTTAIFQNTDKVITEKHWNYLFHNKLGRDLFLKDLDIKRERNCCLNSMRNVHCMTTAMTVFLDKCLEDFDVKSAMRISNMANTFYYISSGNGLSSRNSDRMLRNESNNNLPTIAESTMDNYLDSSSDGVDNTVEIETIKCYIHKESKIQSHSIWREPGFWDVAMLMGVTHQLDRAHIGPNQPGMAFHWEDIENEDELREIVMEIHNCIFGQLGSIAFTMHDVGLSLTEVGCLVYNYV